MFSTHLTKVPELWVRGHFGPMCQSKVQRGPSAFQLRTALHRASGRPVIPPRQRSTSSLKFHGYLYSKEAKYAKYLAQKLKTLSSKLKYINDPDISYNREIARDRGTMRHSSLLQQSSQSWNGANDLSENLRVDPTLGRNKVPKGSWTTLPSWSSMPLSDGWHASTLPTQSVAMPHKSTSRHVKKIGEGS